jgi:hypothetical protein
VLQTQHGMIENVEIARRLSKLEAMAAARKK